MEKLRECCMMVLVLVIIVEKASGFEYSVSAASRGCPKKKSAQVLERIAQSKWKRGYTLLFECSFVSF